MLLFAWKAANITDIRVSFQREHRSVFIRPLSSKCMCAARNATTPITSLLLSIDTIILVCVFDLHCAYVQSSHIQTARQSISVWQTHTTFTYATTFVTTLTDLFDSEFYVSCEKQLRDYSLHPMSILTLAFIGVQCACRLSNAYHSY